MTNGASSSARTSQASSRIAIVGGGPMCTYAVERLAALLPAVERRRPVEIVIFERTGRFGAGTAHSDEQPWCAYMNRIVAQMALGADESVVDAGVLLEASTRPTFLDWCRRRFTETGESHFDVTPREVPPRRLHGIALREALEGYVQRLREFDGISVSLRAEEVCDLVEEEPRPPRYRLLTDRDPHGTLAELVLLVTGHGTNVPGHDPDGLRIARLAAVAGARYVPGPYPLAATLDEQSVPPGADVAILGAGLAAIDVILQLTEGRGGCFRAASSGGLAYYSSGREPHRITPVGPSGLLPRCRPLNEKVSDDARASIEHQPAFFTIEAVGRLRAVGGRPATLRSGSARQLDFDRQVYPLVVLEMAYAYYRVLLGDEASTALRRAVAPAYEDFLRAGGAPEREDGVATLLWAVTMWARARGVPEPMHFDERGIFVPLDDPDAWGAGSWGDRALAFARADLLAAREGNLANPVKAACDGVWRDLRGVFCAVADRGGLTPDSHRRFVREHLRSYNRLSNGAGIEAMEKVLALAEAGVLDLGLGPAPAFGLAGGRLTVRGRETGECRKLDAVIEGRVHPFDPWHDTCPLYRNMIRRGLVRQFINDGQPDHEPFVPGGLDIDRYFHPRRLDGTANRNLTVLGNPLESVVFFEASAARPHANNYILGNVARWAAEAVDSL